MKSPIANLKSAGVPRLLLRHFDRVAEAPDAVSRLRQFILDLAVRGKLVPQDPKDEPASELLKRIQTRNGSPLPTGQQSPEPSQPGPDDEPPPSHLPQGWSCVWFNEVYTLEYGDNLPAEKRSNTGEFPVYGSNGIVGTHSTCSVKGPCIVVGRKGSAGALNLSLTAGCCVTDVAYYCTPPREIDLAFSFKLFQTLRLDSLGKGVKPGLSRKEAYALPITIPPLAEQHRIVAKVDELMALCDRLEAAQAEREIRRTCLVAATHAHLSDSALRTPHSAFFINTLPRLTARPTDVSHLRQTILNLAVRGRLVPQDPNDEPAARVLEQIDSAPKHAMRTRGTDEDDGGPSPRLEPLFDLQTGWEWAQFRRLPLHAAVGIDRGRSLQGPEKAFAYFKMNNIRNSGGTDLSELTRIDATPGEVVAFSLTDGDFLFNTRNSRELVGKTCVFRQATVAPVLYNNNILRVKFIAGFSPDFVDYWFRSPDGKAALETLKSNTTNVCAIYQGKLAGFPCPIPPLAEQHRIVAKVDELMALCDRLVAQLTTTQTQSRRLLESTLHHLLAA